MHNEAGSGIALLVLFVGVVVALGAYFYVGGIGGLFGRLAANYAIANSQRRRATTSLATMRADSTASVPSIEAGAGFTLSARLAEIDAKYNNDLTAVLVDVADLVPRPIPMFSLERMGIQMAEELATLKKVHGDTDGMDRFIGTTQEAYLRKVAVAALHGTTLKRTLLDFKDNERAVLRLTEMLEALGELTAWERRIILAPLVWNDGKCLVRPGEAGFDSGDRLAKLREGLGKLISGHFGEAVASAERLQERLRDVLSRPNAVKVEDRSVLERYLFAGARWMTPHDPGVQRLLPNGAGSPTALRLGAFEHGGGDLLYDMAESLTTIAPPGAAKSQGQVIRNLLYYQGGAVVLDIKGEVHARTAGWRSTLGNGAPGLIQRFAPGDTVNSATFNPLDWIRADIRHAWDDAERLAELLVLRDSPGGDSYWRDRGRTLVTTCLTFTALAAPPHMRNMGDVLNQLYSITNEENRKLWADSLAATGHDQLRLEAISFRDMPDNQREGVFDQARTQLRVWNSPDIKEVSQSTTIDFASLRANGTLYLCVNSDDIERFGTVLRTIVGTAMRDLTRNVPDRAAQTVTFFLDEVPRIGRMDVLEKMIDFGRGYGLRVWLFAQNFGQFKEHYPNAEGIVGNCAVRCYMNPNETDAQRLSKLLAEREGLLDGRRKPLADTWELSGPAYADKIIAFIGRNYPARLDKILAVEDRALTNRLGMPLKQAAAAD